MKWKRIELALLAGVMACMVLAANARAGEDMAQKLVRLHVIANSDSQGDQALKLKVRDAVLQESARLGLQKTLGSAECELLCEAAKKAVRENGHAYPVSVERCNMYFDTRRYDGFALPAGQYDAVRVTIGAGKGRNWWCVMFPPLCTGATQKEIDTIAREAGLSEDEIGFISEDGTQYVVRFKLTELWEKLKAWL